MKQDRDDLEKALHRHLSLFGSPSASQIEASRRRVRERLRLCDDAAASAAAMETRAPRGRHAWWAGLSLAAAAAVMAILVTGPWRQADWLATVEAPDGSRRPLAANAVLTSHEAGGSMVTLNDGSRVEVRTQTELLLERAADGVGIRLRTGGLIVNAAEQHDRHLYVHTNELTVAVVGTMFVVNADGGGTRVTVIKGEVRVREGTIETTLRPGGQFSTRSASAARPLKEEIGWSRHKDAILAAFDKGMAETTHQLPLSARPGDAIGITAGGQVARPAFEEASIRQCDPNNLPATPDGGRGGGPNSLRLTQGRLRALCMTVATLIRTAYGYGPADLEFIFEGRGDRPMDFGAVYGLGVEDGRRVRGGPDWVRSERYTIDAVAGPDTAAETLRRTMLQQLLERRFRLKAHIEGEQVPAFALTVAKGGPKIKPVASGACEPLPGKPGYAVLNGQPVNAGPPRSFDDVRKGRKPSCGLWTQRNGPNMVLVAGEVPLTSLVQTLAARLGGFRVIDRTGITDKYNFILEFVLDENSPGLPAGTLPTHDLVEPSDILPAATIFSALEEQLGLAIEPARAPREFIVIDHIERPSPN
jgi:uncharacterized protein (TIGR03435 family)